MQDALDDETLRVKLELKKSMDMYHSLCKEATNAKQKVGLIRGLNAKKNNLLSFIGLYIAGFC